MRSFNKKTKIIILMILILAIAILGGQFLSKGHLSNFGEDKEEELKGDITFVSNRTDKRDEIEEMINSFEELHPDVNIKLELMGDPDKILQRRAAVGELPDVTLVPSTIPKTEYDNYFLTIDDLGFNNDNIYNYDMGAGDDGRLYCLNSSVTWQGVIYNKNIFKELGIEKIPTTIGELFEICEKIKNYGITPIAINYRQGWTMSLWKDIIPHLFDNKLSKETILGVKNILDVDSGMYKSLNLVREIVNRGYCEENLLNYDWQEFKNDMSNGKVAMTIWNSDFMNQLEDMGMDKEDVGIFPIPESQVIKIYGDYKFAVSKNSDYPEVAKAFLKYIFEKDRYANAINVVSPLKSDDDYETKFNMIEGYDIPIEIYTDFVRKQSSEDAKMEEDYLSIRKKCGLDESFVQRYIIEENIESLIDETNKKWQELMQ